MKGQYITSNNSRWYCYSIFYYQEQWITLLQALEKFYLFYKPHLRFFYYRFSTTLGDRLDLIMTFNTNDINPDAIDAYFQEFIKEHPSSNKKSKNWISHTIWMHYKNNSTIWNRTHLPIDILEDSVSKQAISKLTAIGLFASSLFEDIDSVILFLLIKSLKYPIANKNNILKTIKYNTNKLIPIEGIDSLDAYLQYTPKDANLEEALLEWDKFNASHCKGKQSTDYFIKIYRLIQEQYSVDNNKNKLLSDILYQYLFYKTKE